MISIISTSDVKKKASSASSAMRGSKMLELVLLFAGTALLAIYGAARLDTFLAMQQIAIPGSFSDGSAGSAYKDQRPAALVSLPRGEQQLTPSTFAFARVKPLALVRIPAIALEAPLFEGTDALTLNHGLGRIPGTARLGEAGNIGIAGHRDSALRALKDIKMGDRIEVGRPRRTDVYIVEQIRIVSPEQVEVLEPRAYPTLTLVTCYPFHFLGAAPQRFVVTASLANP